MKKMLTLMLTGVMVAGLTVGTARAENSLQAGAIGFSAGIGEDSLDLSGRYFLIEDLAILGGVGLMLQGGDLDRTYFNLAVGLRKYLTRDDFAFFVGGRVDYTKNNENEVEDDYSRFNLLGNVGVEYFIAKRFSVEGSVGAGFAFGKEGGESYFSIGTFTRSLAATFYF